MKTKVIAVDFISRLGIKTNLPDAMVQEILGGFSNLYLEGAVESGGFLKITTERGLVSKFFSSSTLIREIQNCSGMDANHAEATLKAVEETVKEIFEAHGMLTKESAIIFQPLGTITVLDPQIPSYEMVYEDPARPDYHSFLLGDGQKA